MKKVLLVLLLLCSGLLFADEKNVTLRVGSEPYYFSVDKIYVKKTRIVEIVPVNEVCKVAFSDGTIIYIKKGESVCYEYRVDYGDLLHDSFEYEGIVKDFDYNYFILDVHKVSDF